VVGGFRHQHTGFGAAYVNGRQPILVLIRHAYGCSCPFAIAGLGFLLLWVVSLTELETAVEPVGAPPVCEAGDAATGAG
jgi:hypothetical protein